MSFALPHDIEESIKRFAQERRISHDEAVLRLIENGLKTSESRPRIKGLSGKPMSDEEAAIVDDALAIAMEARRERAGIIIT